MSLGKTISQRRKQLGLTQKDLASNVQKNGGGAITPQYLNDIEHDRRAPTSPELIEQFADALELDEHFLYYQAGTIPRKLKKKAVTPEKISAAFEAFRKQLEAD
jgi:transcriptional regulator with XRE-family HTH domain